jgi:hypothetical protein
MNCRYTNIPSLVAHHGLLGIPVYVDTDTGILQRLGLLVEIIRKRR